MEMDKKTYTVELTGDMLGLLQDSIAANFAIQGRTSILRSKLKYLYWHLVASEAGPVAPEENGNV